MNIGDRLAPGTWSPRGWPDGPHVLPAQLDRSSTRLVHGRIRFESGRGLSVTSLVRFMAEQPAVTRCLFGRWFDSITRDLSPSPRRIARAARWSSTRLVSGRLRFDPGRGLLLREARARRAWSSPARRSFGARLERHRFPHPPEDALHAIEELSVRIRLAAPVLSSTPVAPAPGSCSDSLTGKGTHL